MVKPVPGPSGPDSQSGEAEAIKKLRVSMDEYPNAFKEDLAKMLNKFFT